MKNKYMTYNILGLSIISISLLVRDISILLSYGIAVYGLGLMAYSTYKLLKNKEDK